MNAIETIEATTLNGDFCLVFPYKQKEELLQWGEEKGRVHMRHDDGGFVIALHQQKYSPLISCVPSSGDGCSIFKVH